MLTELVLQYEDAQKRTGRRMRHQTKEERRGFGRFRRVRCARVPQKIVDAIYAEARRRGKAGVISVCDAHGDLIALVRMDGAPLSSITISINKAYSAARERKPSKEIGVAARRPGNGFDIGYFGDRKFTGWGGGVPLFRDGSVLGAVAVSGLPQAEDIELAELGAAVFAALV